MKSESLGKIKKPIAKPGSCTGFLSVTFRHLMGENSSTQEKTTMPSVLSFLLDFFCGVPEASFE